MPLVTGCNLKKFSGDFIKMRPVTGKGPTEPIIRESAKRPVTEKLPTELFEITGGARPSVRPFLLRIQGFFKLQILFLRVYE